MKHYLQAMLCSVCCFLFLFFFGTQKSIAQSISNYGFAASSGTFTALTGATNPALTSGNTDEGYFNSIPVGFDFWYMGVRCTTISASTNGWLSMGVPCNAATPANNLNSGGGPRPLIAPLWDNLDIQSTTNVSYKTTGVAGSRIFTVEYLNVKWNQPATGSVISFQVKLYEATGKISFIYRPETVAVNGGSASIGIAAASTGTQNFLSLDGTGTSPAANAYSETATLATKPATGQVYTFTPIVPTTAPASLVFSGVTTSSTTLSWTDNSTNEDGFVIYNSTDGVNYTFVAQTSANATSSIQTGLSSSTTYYWKVYAVTEGALSTAVSGTQATTCSSAAPTVVSPVNYCQGATAAALTATGTNLLWGGLAGSAGGTSVLTSTIYTDNSYNNRKTNFTTTTGNVILTSVDYYIPAYQSVSGLALSLYNNSGTVIATSSTTTSSSAGATTVKITSTFNYTIVTAGAYSVGVSAGTGNIGSDNPSFPITESTGTINITGVSSIGYRCFNNMQFTTVTSSTAPTPLTSSTGTTSYLVTQTVAGCTSPQSTIIVNVTSPNLSQVPASGLTAYFKMNGNANDVTGNDNGALQNAPTTSADRFGNAGKAYTFNGTTQYMSTATAYANPGDFTVSIWFKTSTANGGRLIGFGSLQTGQSGQYDRHLYMNNAGQIYFGVYSGSVYTVNSALSYNDNNWHLATGTVSSTGGMVLYMDGVQVGTNASGIAGENYTGYWRIGYDNNNGWTSQPGSFYFAGALDDALIYNRAISPAEANTIYKSSDGAGNSGPVCAGSILSLTAPTLSGATYAWTGPAGFTSSSQNPTLTYLAANAGLYTLQVTVSGCSATAYTNVITTAIAGQWTGSISTDWANANNWCSGVVPASTTDVTIATGATYMPSIISSVNCNSLTINAGATVTTTAAGTLNIAGTLTNNGTMVNSGTTNFNGTGGQQTFTGVTAFYNITLSNSSGLLLPVSITANNILISAGTLKANNFSITAKGNWVNNVSTAAFTAGTGTVTFNGTAAQSIGGGFVTTFNNLTISDTAATVSLTSNESVAGNLSVNNGIFDIGSFTANRATAGGTLTVANNATLKIGGTNSFPSNYNTSNLVVASTVEYSGTNQTVASQLYGNLTLSSSSGAAIKTFSATAVTIAGNLTSNLGAGTSVSYTAAANITVSGNVSIGASTTFNSSSFSHSIGGNWVNSGTFTGSTGTITFTGAGSLVSGTGAQNFNNLTVAASSINFSNGSLILSGNLATTGAGSFVQAAGGTLTMTGTGTTISGNGISLENLTISGTVTTAVSLVLTGNLSVSGSFSGSANNISFTGASKTISGAGTKSFSALLISGSITTNADFSISAGIIVNGSFSASAGTATFTSSSTLSGTANLFDVTINGTALQLSANAVLGIANTLTISAGTLNVTSSIPNTVNFNGNGAQNINAIAYNNLMLSNGSTKTAIAALTINNSLTIGAGTTFTPGAYTHSIYVNWNNYGTFTAGGSTIQFLGSLNSNINGATTFNVLTINTTATTGINLLSNVSASTVNMMSGNMFTGTNTITITTTRTGPGIILGNIQRTHAFVTGVAYAFEGPNNTVTFSAVSGVASITVSAVDAPSADFPFGGSIGRFYNILVSGGTYNATLRLHYDDDELNGNNESTMTLWQYSGSSWSSIGKTANSTTLNYVEQSGLTNITNRWTCSDNSNVVVWNGSVSTDWNTANNWTVTQGSASRPPSSTNIVDLGTATFTNQPTISTTVTVKNINFGSVQAVALSMASGGSLTSGDIDGDWTTNKTHTINANNQTITVNGNLDLSDNISGHAINLNIGSGSVNVTGSLMEAGGANIVFSGAGNLNIGVDFNYVNGTFTPGTGTVTYNGAENQAIGAVNYNNLIINKSAALATINNILSIGGNLTLLAGELDNLSTATILGNVTIATGTILQNFSYMHVGGNWLNNGTFIATGAYVIFDGSGSQSISSTTFNNLIINKPVGSIATQTGDVIMKGDLTITSGTLDIGSYLFNRDVAGGTATIADAGTFVIGADNEPTNFSNYSLGNSSTVIFNGTTTQHLPGISYGNLIIQNTGTKILYAPITVNGDLTIASGATFDGGGANTITLNGNWINGGTFIPSATTLVLSGAGKTVTGNTTFNKVNITGSYTNLSDITYNDLLHITSSGSISSGTGIFTTLNGDLTNNGVLNTSGTTTFTGTQLQTLSLINAVSTFALIVNFNGTVSPVLNSTSPPQYGYLNINNTGGVNPSVGWTVAYAMTVSAGASFNGGSSTHNFYGPLTNSGAITSSGTLSFVPSAAVTLNLGTSFNSTGRVTFGGAGAITLSGTPTAFHNVLISNTNAAGIMPSSAWPIDNNLTVNSGAIFNAGSYTHLLGGNLLNNGTINSGTSTFTLNGGATQTLYSLSAFNNLTINKTAGFTTLLSNATVNGTLLFTAGKIQTGSNALVQPQGGTITGAGQSTGWVFGNLQKNIATGATNKTFEVGDSAYYTPAGIAFANVTTAGNLLVNTIPTEHPAIASSLINAAKSVNRYWSFTNSGIGFTSYTGTYNFVAGDIDAGADTAAFNVSIYNGSSWIVPVTAAPRATSIQATGVTSFGDCAIGEICNRGTSILYAASPYCINAGTAAVTLTGSAGGTFTSSAGLAINSSTGLIDLTTSTLGSYVVTYTIAANGQCGNYITNTTVVIGTAGSWTGAFNSDWNNTSNWSCGGVPTAASNVTIPSGLTNYPVITAIIALNNLLVQNGASITVSGATLQIAGTISNSGIINANAGTIEMIGSSAQTIPANTFAGNAMQNLIISNDVSLAGQLNITGTLSFGASSKTFSTGGYLTLKSTVAGTAQFADITNAGANTGNSITGHVTIERFIPAKRAWRLLAAPVCSCSPPSINAAWQEGSTGGNPSSGYGTQITGGTIANGYDQGSTANASLKYYNTGTHAFTGIPLTPGTNALITAYPGYFLFIRGDRSTSLQQGVSAAISNTTLRMSGQLNTGNFTTTVNAANVTLAGNPYPAMIDFHSLTRSNVNDKVYLWDPKMGGTNGLGAYVTLLWNGSSYDATSSVSPESRYIPSGEAFFVESADGINPGTITFKETDKNTGGSDLTFRPMDITQSLRVNLAGINTDSSTYLLDGVLTTYSDVNSNAVDRDDALKFYNYNENIAIGRDGKILSIERRHNIDATDTTFLNLYLLKKVNYKLQLNTQNLDNNGLYAVIKDSYSSTINNTPVNMNGLTEVTFNVNADSASFAANRFSIVFIKLAPLPVTFTSIKAYRQQKNIKVDFTTATELGIKDYEVQAGSGGNIFKTTAIITAKANNGANAAYTWLDINAKQGQHYYRVKANSINGIANFSPVVNVNITDNALPGIQVYGNTIKGGTISVQLTNIVNGTYQLELYNTSGQLLSKMAVENPGVNATVNFTIDKYVPAGKYVLLLAGKTATISTSLIKE